MRHLQQLQVFSPLVEQKSTLLKILHFLYWRRVWLANYYKAAVRYIRNYTVLANQIASMYVRLIKLAVLASIRILKSKLAKLFHFRKASKGADIPTLKESISLAKGFYHWSFIDLLRFLQQRFSYQSKAYLDKNWNYVSKSNLTNAPDHEVNSANLVFHVHYLDIAIEMIDYLIHTNVVFNNVVITCTDDELKLPLKRAAKQLAHDTLEVITVENSYRDARPFLIALQRLKDNLPILKIHTKKSPHLSEIDGIAWRQSLLEGLVPDANDVARFTTLLKSESVPMVIIPKQWLASRKHWGHNDIHLYSICRVLEITMVRKAPFPMGTMFWANKELIDEIRKLPIPGFQDAREAHWADSTWAHGFERAIGQIIANRGKGVALI